MPLVKDSRLHLLLRALLSAVLLSLDSARIGAQQGPACGDPLGPPYQGVTAFSNDSGVDGDIYEPCAGRGTFGLRYECVEYIRRFYDAPDPADSSFATATRKWQRRDAVQFFDDASTLGLAALTNNVSVLPPMPDDILVFGTTSDNPHGHVAIITGVAAKSVDVIEQNFSRNGTAHLALNPRNANGSYTIPSRGSYPIRGWLRPFYDSFDSSTIDSTKWFPATDIHSATAVRGIENGKLRLTSMTATVGDVITTAVGFISPSTIKGFQATVAVDQIGTGFTDNQVARLIGTFYKSNGLIGGAGADGDIVAAMRITGNQASGLQASFTMFRCLGQFCAAAPHVFTDVLGSVALGSRNMLVLVWDGARFAYGVNTVTRIFDPSGVAPVVSQTPGLQTKVLDTQAFFSGLISATFDDVVVAR